MNDALAGFAQFAGGTRSTDALILAAFLESQTLLERLNGGWTSCGTMRNPSIDPVFALAPSHHRGALHPLAPDADGARTDPGTGLVDLRSTPFRRRWRN
jgi:hypothetical protein